MIGYQEDKGGQAGPVQSGSREHRERMDMMARLETLEEPEKEEVMRW